MGMRNGMYIVEAGDVISGKQAVMFFSYEKDGAKVRLDCGWFKTLTATMEKNKSEFYRLGTESAAHKANGWTGKGEAEMFYATTAFRQLALEYATTGKDVYGDIVVMNEDQTSDLGKQTITLKNVNFDNIVITAFDVDSDDPLMEEMNFTFDGFEIIDSFNAPARI